MSDRRGYLSATPLASPVEKLRRWIRELAHRHVEWGWKLVSRRRLRLEGWSINHKMCSNLAVGRVAAAAPVAA